MQEYHVLDVFPAPAGMNRFGQANSLVDSSVPRACGDEPKFHLCQNRLNKCSPAPAGMNRLPSSALVSSTSVPRACGDEPTHLINGTLGYECSPRLRG